MRKTIWKFTLSWRDIQTVEMPAGAEPLAVHFMFDQLYVWALVDSDEQAREGVDFAIVGTGCSCFCHSWRHLGTVVDRGRSLVWHVFTKKKESNHE